MSYFYRHRFRCRSRRLHALLAVVIGLTFTYLYCEYFIYYVVQSKCDWPALSSGSEGGEPVQALILADTHLLSSRNGHWLDKMRREWQMHRAFQAAIALHNPQLVFVLGDLFDEGLWCSEQEFSDYVERFHRLFRVPDHVTLYTAAGNHDIGFHYRITPQLMGRFEQRMESPPVKLVSVRGNHFVLLNSMAMEGDGCALCSRAQRELERLSNVLKCTSGSSACQGGERLSHYSRPILMQHFPLHRASDAECAEGDAPPAERGRPLEQRRDCLSREATRLLAEALSPRAAFGGHTHHACRKDHRLGDAREISFAEYSVASFSHRNRISPEYVLATFTPANYAVNRCRIPEEATIKWSAAVLLLLTLVYVKCVVYGPLYRTFVRI